MSITPPSRQLACKFIAGLTAIAAFSGLASAQTGQATPPVIQQPATPPAQNQLPTAQPVPLVPQAKPTEVAQPSALTGKLLYQLLLAELHLQQGEPAEAFALLLDSARQAADERLYQRAVEVALAARAGDSALQGVKAWKLANPNSREANRQLLFVLVALNRILETETPLRDELAFAPSGELDAMISILPRFFARTSDKKLAASTLERALAPQLQNSATAAQAWTSIGRLRFAGADLSGAVNAASMGHRADPKSLAPILLATDLIDPKVPEAEALVVKFLQVSSDIDVRLSYARNLLAYQRTSDAFALVEVVVKDSPTQAEPWLMQAALQQSMGKGDAAEASARKYLELMDGMPASQVEPGQRQAFFILAEAAEKRRDFVASESWLNKIGEADALIGVTLRRANLLVKQGQMDKARALIRQQPERGPEDAKSKVLAEISLLRDAKLYAEAFELLGRAAATYKADTELTYDQAMMAEKLNRFDEMERLLRQVIAARPEASNAYNALGYSLADRNVKLVEAKVLISKALELSPGDAYITDSLAWVEYRMGNRAEALKLLLGAFKSRPDAEIAAHLGELQWVLGDKKTARATWAQGLELNAQNESLLETMKRLDAKP